MQRSKQGSKNGFFVSGARCAMYSMWKTRFLSPRRWLLQASLGSKHVTIISRTCAPVCVCVIGHSGETLVTRALRLNHTVRLLFCFVFVFRFLKYL